MCSARLDPTVCIAVMDPLRIVNLRLLDLLASFSAEDWCKPTVHTDRDVKDLVAHLLHGSLRRVTALRDCYNRPPARAITGFDDLVAFIQEDNRAFIRGMQRVSPAILVELIARYDAEFMAQLGILDPHSSGLGVAWAGDATSPNWFDVAREYTEKWHHQQQLRDATGRPPLYEPELLGPVLETFARGLPFAYRACVAAPGTSVAVNVTGTVPTSWSLLCEASGWSLWSGARADAATTVRVPGDVAWRLWTKGLSEAEARALTAIDGDASLATPLFGFVAIMA
jgi:Mycothiol maleylpyruvate isomerase N-terminal domain